MTILDTRRVLIVAAHPDDEVLGCGGTAARLSRAGADVAVAILGEGITSRYDQRLDADPDALEQIKAQCRTAGRALGISSHFFFDYPDNRFDTVPLLKIVKSVETAMMQVRPNIVFTHHHGDLNIDHVLTERAVRIATRPMAGSDTPAAVYSFEVPSSTEWGFHVGDNPFMPDTFVDITGTLDAKLQALDCYSDEVHRFPHPRSGANLRHLAAWRGSAAGMAAAEAFVLVRQLVRGDI